MIEESKDELQKMLNKPGKSHAVSSRNDFIAGYNEIAGKQAQVQEAIASFFGLEFEIDRQIDVDTPPLTKIPGPAHGSRQLIGMTTVNLGVVCKLLCFST